MAAAAADDAVAADIICSLRGADLAGWTPPWGKRATETEAAAAAAGELSWPALARGKRSRRRSPSASASGAAGGKGSRFSARSSPASPLEYSASSLRSGASTSGGEDGGFCSPWHRRAVTAPLTPTPTTKVGSTGRPQLTFQAPPPRPAGQRQRKKMRLPEVQQLVRSLAAENESLHEEKRALLRACAALSKENDKLEIRVEQSNSRNETALKEQKGKQPFEQQSPHDSFALPDLNLPAQDNADSSSVLC